MKGRLEHYISDVGKRFDIRLEKECEKQGFFACYCYKGQISIEAMGKFEVLAEGDLVLISYDDILNLNTENNGDKECSLIAAFIEV